MPSSWPSISSWNACALVISLAGFFASQRVSGHVYLMQPVSRNFFYTTAFQSYSFPDITYCPHCFQSRGPMQVRARAEANTPSDVLDAYGGGAWPLKTVYERGELADNGNYLEPEAISVRHGICGDPEQTAAEGRNVVGRENSVYPVLETYEEGSVIQMKTIISTYHWGHLEFFICNAEDLSGDGEDAEVTQGCFNMHPLTRAEGDGAASPIDPNHPGRYFLDPPCRKEETDQTIPDGAFAGYVVTSHYQLPAGLSCERCIVQMIYYTGNACHHPGYEEFNPPSWPGCAPTKADWITLDPGMCGDGDRYPEEFWNCADISITSDGRRPSSDDDGVTPAPSSDPNPPGSTPAPTTPGLEPTPQPSAGVDATPSPTMDEFHTAPPTDEAQTPAPSRQPKYPKIHTFSPTPPPGAPTPSPTPSPTRMPITMHTFEPTTAEDDDEDDDCSDPAGGWQQCGGSGWSGATCCRPGYQCDELSDGYSQCRPHLDACSWHWEQCGGQDWDGPVCCASGSMCTTRNMWYSQCAVDAIPAMIVNN